jgi:hypothetical protein
MLSFWNILLIMRSHDILFDHEHVAKSTNCPKCRHLVTTLTCNVMYYVMLCKSSRQSNQFITELVSGLSSSCHNIIIILSVHTTRVC